MIIRVCSWSWAGATVAAPRSRQAVPRLYGAVPADSVRPEYGASPSRSARRRRSGQRIASSGWMNRIARTSGSVAHSGKTLLNQTCALQRPRTRRSSRGSIDLLGIEASARPHRSYCTRCWDARVLSARSSSRSRADLAPFPPIDDFAHHIVVRLEWLLQSLLLQHSRTSNALTEPTVVAQQCCVDVRPIFSRPARARPVLGANRVGRNRAVWARNSLPRSWSCLARSSPAHARNDIPNLT
jgi:hypothetical protein